MQSNKSRSYTKSGPGRRHRQGKRRPRAIESFSATLVRLQAEKRAAALRKAARGQRDRNGAYTLVGRPHGYGRIDTSNLLNGGRRVWLAGVSSQRGY